MLLALIAFAMGQEGPETVVTPHLQVRPRAVYNYTDGAAAGIHRSRPLGPAAFDRSRLGLEVSRGIVRGSVGVQSSILWRYDPDTDDYALVPPNLNVYEALVGLRFELPSDLDIDVDVGRQRLTIHNGRLISANDFLVDARILDGVHVDIRTSGLHVAALQYRDFSRIGDDIESLASGMLYGGLHGESVRGHWYVDAVVLRDDPLDALITGVVGEREVGRFHGGGEAYFSGLDVFGGDPTRTYLLASAWAGVTLGPERLVELTARYDLVTDDVSDTEGPGIFQGPASEVHDVFGQMDLFQTAADTDGRGLHDFQGRIDILARRRFEFGMHAHVFALQDQFDWLGVETDFRGSWVFSPILEMELGVQVFRGTNTFRDIHDLRLWQAGGYAQLDLTL